MGLFKKKLAAPPPPVTPIAPVTSEMSKWIENILLWLMSSFGTPTNTEESILWNEKFFPESFKLKKIDIDTLLSDICNLLLIERAKISYELQKDIRDINQGPRMMSGTVFKSDLEIIKDESGKQNYTLHIANKLLERDEILLTRIILELLKVKCLEKELTSDPEIITTPFAYLAGIFFGFSVILSKTLINIGTSYRAGWQANWRDSSELDYLNFAYALAVYLKLLECKEYPTWTDILGSDVKEEFEKDVQYLNEHPEVLGFDKNTLGKFIAEKEHYAKARKYYSSNSFSEAIKEYEKVIPLTENIKTLASLNISIGYSYLRLLKYEMSIPYFMKALEFNPSHGYAFDNMGFAYIMLGQYEKGRDCLEKAIATNNNDNAYSMRNMALYYMKQGELEHARKYFTKTYEMNKPVDLLDYFYAQFLLSQSQKDEAMEYLSMAVEKGEPEAIALMNEIK